MSKKLSSQNTAHQQPSVQEHECQILLKKCAELLLDMHTEYAALHYSIYEDDEHDEDDDGESVFESLCDDSNKLIKKLKELKILDSRR